MAFISLREHFLPPLSHGDVIEAELEPEPPPAPLDLDAERAAAWRDGWAQAEDVGRQRAEALEAQLELKAVLLDEVARARKAALDAAAEDVAKLVVEITRRVIGDSLTFHPNALPALVTASLGRLPDEDDLVVRVPEASVALVASIVPERHRGKVIADPGLQSGCIVETRHASIEASVDAALEAISAQTAAWLAGRR